jgi:hypothetical protein
MSTRACSGARNQAAVTGCLRSIIGAGSNPPKGVDYSYVLLINEEVYRAKRSADYSLTWLSFVPINLRNIRNEMTAASIE